MLERVASRTVLVGECWVFQGSGPNGYGKVSLGGRGEREELVHRWAYDHFIGPIPDGLHIDHVKARGCQSRKCWNPAHLEAVTQQVNNQRAAVRGRRRAERCLNGHLLDDANRGSGGKCKACHRARQAAYMARRRRSE